MTLKELLLPVSILLMVEVHCQQPVCMHLLYIIKPQALKGKSTDNDYHGNFTFKNMMSFIMMQ